MTELEPHDQAEEVLAAVREYVGEDLPHFSDSLRGAYRVSEPVFARRQYADFFWHCATTVPGWLAAVIFANAQKESEGSAKLLELWRGVDYNADVERWVLAHAKDESRHSRVFLKLAMHSFPQLVGSAEVERLNRELPDVRRREHMRTDERLCEDILIDYLVQINIGEIRTRLHMHLFAPAIFGCTPDHAKEKVHRILRALERDEVRHIGYTARIMERWAESGDARRIGDLYRQRLHEFHTITLQETESAVHAFGQGRFPDLLEV